MQLNKELFLSLIRLGIGHSPYFKTENVVWSNVEVFAAFAVEYLGMPVEAMPFFNQKRRR